MIDDAARLAVLRELFSEEQARLLKLREQLRHLQEEMRLQEHHVAKLHTRLNGLTSATAGTPGARSQPASGVSSGAGEVPSASGDDGIESAQTLADRVVTVLQEAGKPVRLTDLTDEIAKTEQNAPRSRLQNSIASALVRRTDLFVRHDRGLYGLREWGAVAPPQPETALNGRGTEPSGPVLSRHDEERGETQ